MSKGYWQTMRQTERLGVGGTLTQKIETYVTTWERRCYSDGIPDEIPRKLAAASRAPNYKSIAMAILRNDLKLRSLGFGESESQIVEDLRRIKAERDSPQQRLF